MLLKRLSLVICIIFANLLEYNVKASKILCFYPNTSRSHLVIATALMKELASKGHNVTVVSGFPHGEEISNYREIFVQVDDLYKPLMEKFLEDPSEGQKSSSFKNKVFNTLKIKMEAAERGLNAPEFRKIMKTETFDLVIVGYFMADFVLALGHHFHCPTILLISTTPMDNVDILFGNPTHFAVGKASTFDDNKFSSSLLQRISNVYNHLCEHYTFSYIDNYQEFYYRRNFPENSYPPLNQIKKNVSLVLMNSHFSKNMPRSYLPNMIEVGGLHLKYRPITTDLPSDIKEFIDGAEHGVIFFSLGANLKGSNMPATKLEIILKTFSKLKQRILWKWEDDNMPNKPDNVMLGKWFPQSSILAHENVKLFITHGGLGSVTEAMFIGVPIVGVPVFFDQFTNTKMAADEGWAVNVKFEDLNGELFNEAISKVLSNSSYRKSVEKLSKLYRDRPQHPMDTAIYWIEYVIRHNGAPHMHYQGKDLNFIQTNSLDVFAAFLFLLCFLVVFISFLVKMLMRAFSAVKKEKNH